MSVQSEGIGECDAWNPCSNLWCWVDVLVCAFVVLRSIKARDDIWWNGYESGISSCRHAGLLIWKLNWTCGLPAMPLFRPWSENLKRRKVSYWNECSVSFAKTGLGWIVLFVWTTQNIFWFTVQKLSFQMLLFSGLLCKSFLFRCCMPPCRAFDLKRKISFPTEMN